MSKLPNLKPYHPVATAILDGDENVITGIRLSVCELHEDEDPVQSGLSFTPSKMLELASQGVPVSTQTAGATFDDGYRDLDFEPDLQYQRGIDFADLWERELTAKKKFKKAIHEVSQQQKTE